MATYYKYAERDANSQVNWSEITSNMVNSLKEVQTIRDSKRKAINDATTELSTTLSEAPQGEHKGLNEFAMTYANNAQEMRLMQDKLLKSGQLKLKDYNIGRANLTQGTSKLFNLSKKYQAQYKVKMDRLEGGLSATQEQWQMSELEGFANFSNHEAYINPTNGQVNMGKLIDKEVAGKTVRTMDRTPGSFTTIDQLNFAVSDQVNKYNLDNFNAEVSNFAKTYLTTNGAYSSLDDVRQMPEFESMKKNIIKSQLVDPRAVGSILTNFVGIASNGKSFTFTRDPNKKDANTILLVDDPNQPGSGRLSPDFSGSVGKKQMESAEKFLDTQLEKQLPRKETTKAVPDLTPSEIAARATRKKEDEMISNVGKLMTGDETQIQTVLGYFRDLNDKTKKVRRTPDAIEVTFEKQDGKLETRDIKFYVETASGKKAKTVAQFIESASNLLTGSSPSGIKTILERGNYDKNATFNESLTEDYVAEIDVDDVVEEGQDMEKLDKKLNLAVKDLDFYGEDEGVDKPNPNYNPEEEESDDNPKTINVGGLRNAIKKAFPDFELSITPIDNDKFIIDVAGYDGSVTIEGDFMSINNVEGEKEKRNLKAFMKTLYIQKFKKNKGKTNTSTDTDTETGGNSR